MRRGPGMSDYLADERPISGDEFTRRACDPHASVVVEACAGSGKTWLLVARIIRALLAGYEPGEILAITFTRRAAQEMRARLLSALQELAQGDDAAVQAFLRARDWTRRCAIRRGACPQALRTRRHRARAGHCRDLPRWFWRLIARAPLGAGVPLRRRCSKAPSAWRADAWLHFTAMLVREEHAEARAAWEWLVDELGDFSARKLLLQFLHKRASGGAMRRAMRQRRSRVPRTAARPWVMRTRWPGCGRRKSSRRCRNCWISGDYRSAGCPDPGGDRPCATLAAIGRRSARARLPGRLPRGADQGTDSARPVAAGQACPQARRSGCRALCDSACRRHWDDCSISSSSAAPGARSGSMTRA